MKRWQWIGGTALVLIMALAGVAAYKARQVETSMGVETANAFTNVRDLPSPLVGKEAPRIGLTSVTGGSLDLAQYGGKLVLVTFWSDF